MLQFGACPRCKLDIAPERKKAIPVICDHCGYSHSRNEEKAKWAAEKQTIIIYSTFVAFALASYVQLVNWDNHSIEMIPLKIKETIGMTSTSDADRTAEICMDLKKWDCVESNYIKVSEADSSKLPRLGHFLMKRAKYNDAAQTYYKFFQKSGQDLDASYNYAKALAKLGKVDEATKYFEAVLAARPDVLQVTVVQNYVKLLMDSQRYDQAKKLIQDIRGKGPDSAMFMETEYKKIQSIKTASRE